MNKLEKYNELLSKPQLTTTGLTLQVSLALEMVKIAATIGQIHDEKAFGFTETNIFLNPVEVDNLIERLKIAKDMLVEKLNEKKLP